MVLSCCGPSSSYLVVTAERHGLSIDLQHLLFYIVHLFLNVVHAAVVGVAAELGTLPQYLFRGLASR